MSKKRGNLRRFNKPDTKDAPVPKSGIPIWLIIGLAVFSVWAYNAYDDWVREEQSRQYSLAVSLGFVSIDEMKELNGKGFKTKDDFNNAEAKKLGFKSYEEMSKRVAQGFKTGQDLELAIQKARSLGFESVDEMIEIQSKGFKTKAEKVAKDKADEAARLAQEKINLSNPQWLMEKYNLSAATACSFGADSYLRSVAKYSFKWDDIGWFEAKFDSYSKNLKSPGVVTLASDKVSLQSGLGAYQRITIYCDYDTQAEKVLSYDILN